MSASAHVLVEMSPAAKPESPPKAEGEEGVHVDKLEGGSEDEEKDEEEQELSSELEEILKTCDQIQQRVGGTGAGGGESVPEKLEDQGQWDWGQEQVTHGLVSY